MAAPIKVFSSAQGNGPGVLTGAVDEINTILYQCLVNGYDDNVSVSSLAVSSGTATVTTSASHGFSTNDVITIAGVDDVGADDLNGDFIITVTGGTTFTYATDAADDASVSGTITAETANCGWTRPYTDTNKATFRPSVGDRNRSYLQINNTRTDYATTAMYETMTASETGTNVAQTGYWWMKSGATDSAWWLIADDRFMYLVINAFTASYANAADVYCFGEYNTSWHSFQYNYIMIGATSNSNQPGINNFGRTLWATNNYYNGQFIQRGYTGTTSTVATKFGGQFDASATMGYNRYAPLTGAGGVSPADSSVHLLPVHVRQYSSGQFLGTMPGLYEPFEETGSGATSTPNFATGDRTIVIDGRTYFAVSLVHNVSSSIYRGNCWFDVTGPWR